MAAPLTQAAVVYKYFDGDLAIPSTSAAGSGFNEFFRQSAGQGDAIIQDTDATNPFSTDVYLMGFAYARSETVSIHSDQTWDSSKDYTFTVDWSITDTGRAGEDFTISMGTAGSTLQNTADSTLVSLNITAVPTTLTMQTTSIFISGADIATAGANGQNIFLSALYSDGKVHHLESFELTAVPEPSSTALLGLGGLALILRRRR